MILSKIASIDNDILFVIDNAEDLIQNDKSNFKTLISMILQRVPYLKVFITSRIRLTSTEDFKEELIFLNNLNNQ